MMSRRMQDQIAPFLKAIGSIHATGLPLKDGGTVQPKLAELGYWNTAADGSFTQIVLETGQVWVVAGARDGQVTMLLTIACPRGQGFDMLDLGALNPLHLADRVRNPNSATYGDPNPRPR